VSYNRYCNGVNLWKADERQKKISTTRGMCDRPTMSPCSCTNTLRSLKIWLTSIISLYTQTSQQSSTIVHQHQDIYC